MEDKILIFGKIEWEKFFKNMVEKKIFFVIDEIFFKEMCLVGVEFVLNFIFVE